jgi:hypothetical protein
LHFWHCIFRSETTISPLCCLSSICNIEAGMLNKRLKAIQEVKKYTIEKNDLQVTKAWLRRNTQLDAALCFMRLRQRVFTYICTLVQKDKCHNFSNIRHKDFRNHGQMPQARRMREIVCALIRVLLQSERWICQYWSACGSSCNHVTEVGRPYVL